MFIKLKIRVTISVLTFAIATFSFAHETPFHKEKDNDLFYFSLEELLKTEISVASKTAFLPQDAPGIVTVYNRQDIKETGYITLADFADITPGYSSYNIYGERVFETRGQKAGSYDNHKHLLLIDGIPVAHARANKVITEEELPLYFADSIEFLRGPGSALYGTGAFFGVVSINPKEREEYGAESEINLALGTYDNNKRYMANYYQTEQGGRLSVNMSYFDKDASKDSVGQIEDPLFVNFDDQKSSFFRYKYEITEGFLDGLETGAIYMETRSGIGEFWTHTPLSHEINDITWETLVPYIRYNRKISEALNLSSYLKYNRSEQFGVTLLVDRDSFDNFDSGDRPLLVYDVIIENWEFNLEGQYDSNIDRNLIFGFNYDTRIQDDDSFFYNINTPGSGVTAVSDFNADQPTDRIKVASIYGQYQDRFPVLEGLLVTAGVRFDNGKSDTSKYNNWSPRLSLVQKLDPKWNIKYLAGQALRSPGLKETGLNQQIVEVQSQNGIIIDAPPIEPEIILSHELGVTYNDESTLASLTFFTNKTTDVIDRVPVANATGGVAIYQNVSDEIEAKGVEIEVKQLLSNSWKMFANYSYASSEDKAGVEISDVPYGKVNLGITYHQNNYFANLIARHVKGYQVADSDTYRDPGSFSVVDFNFSLQLNHTTEVGFQVRNMFDEEYLFPKTSVNYDFPVDELGEVPIPGRHLLLSINITI